MPCSEKSLCLCLRIVRTESEGRLHSIAGGVLNCWRSSRERFARLGRRARDLAFAEFVRPYQDLRRAERRGAFRHGSICSCGSGRRLRSLQQLDLLEEFIVFAVDTSRVIGLASQGCFKILNAYLVFLELFLSHLALGLIGLAQSCQLCYLFPKVILRSKGR